MQSWGHRQAHNRYRYDRFDTETIEAPSTTRELRTSVLCDHVGLCSSRFISKATFELETTCFSIFDSVAVMIRRVISDADDVGNNDGWPPAGIPMSEADAAYDNHDVSGLATLVPSPSAGHQSDSTTTQHHQPIIVVDDQHMEEAENSPPVYHIPKSSSSNSSLSDVSADHNEEAWPGRNEPSNVPQNVGVYPNPSALNRSDSKNSNDSSSGSMRASSQNSSRDWGWFEEIHYSTDGMLSPPDSKRNKASSVSANKTQLRGRLVPHATADQFDSIMPGSIDNGKLTAGDGRRTGTRVPSPCDVTSEAS